MQPFLKFFWIAFLAAMLFNYFALKLRFQERIEKDPSLKPGYDKILKAFLIYGTIPWLIMGLGIVFNVVEDVSKYIIHPSIRNPFIVAFHLSILVIYFLLIRWIFFKDGAAFLSKHPGFMRIKALGYSRDLTSAKWIKIFVVFSVTIGLIGMLLMWFAPFPEHR
jgi:hypothetical protein